MLEKPLLVAASIAAVAFAVMNWDARKENKALEAELTKTEERLAVSESNLAVKTKALAQAIAASAVLQDHLDRTAADADHWEKVAHDLEEKDGADEALNDYERSVLERLLTH